MALGQSAPETPTQPTRVSEGARDAGRQVIWLRGEHDASTVAAIADSIARAIASDDGDVVLDLSEVEFMDAATVGILIRARQFLQTRLRSLELRSPSPSARRVLASCGLSGLLPAEAVDASTGAKDAAGLSRVVASDGVSSVGRPPAMEPHNASGPFPAGAPGVSGAESRLDEERSTRLAPRRGP